MNPWELSASDLLIWGLVLHLVADWPLQNDWMAQNKTLRRQPKDRPGDGMMTPPRMYTPQTRWWDRHPAAYVHSGIHGLLLALVFGWVSILLAISHLLIDTRKPVEWWSKFIGQTQPNGMQVSAFDQNMPLVDVGMEVRFWTDQVFHVICVAIAALVVA